MPVSGGTPSDPFFYKNPQYLIMIDMNKVLDKTKIPALDIDVVLTYDSNNKGSVKLFLCKAGAAENNKGHRGRTT